MSGQGSNAPADMTQVPNEAFALLRLISTRHHTRAELDCSLPRIDDVWNILPIPGAPLNPANWRQIDRPIYRIPPFVYAGPDPTSGSPRVTPTSIQWPVRPSGREERAEERARVRRELLFQHEWNRLRELHDSRYRNQADRPFLPHLRGSPSRTSSRSGPSVDSQAARNLLFWNMNHIEPLLITEPGRQYEVRCPICYHDFSRTATDRMPVRIKDVEGCKDHVFCNKCITKSITSGMGNANKCPLCRTELMAAEGRGQRLRPPHADVSELYDEDEAGAVQNRAAPVQNEPGELRPVRPPVFIPPFITLNYDDLETDDEV
jgi:hypothetical protein